MNIKRRANAVCTTAMNVNVHELRLWIVHFQFMLLYLNISLNLQFVGISAINCLEMLGTELMSSIER